MEIIFEILKVVLSPIIAGLFTFFITKYTYNKNFPLDKMEIAYNRIYYPMYRIISDKNINKNEKINEIISKSKIYFDKYEKYIDISTKKLFESLCKCTKKAEQKSVYKKFEDNIYDRNSYLRTKLGYLQPNFIQAYKYLLPTQKSILRMIIEVVIIYISFTGYSITINRFKNVSAIFITIISLIVVIFFYEIVWYILRFLYYKIRK